MEGWEVNANPQLNLGDDIIVPALHPVRRGRLPCCEGAFSLWQRLCERNLGRAAVRPGHVGLLDDLVRSGCGCTITGPIIVGGVVWGYWKPYPLLLGKEMRDRGVIVKHQ